MSNVRPTTAPKPKISRVEVYWTAISYRTVAIYALLALLIVLGVLYLIFPEWYASISRKVSEAVGRTAADAPMVALNQARFVNLDGRVQVKKLNAVDWTTATLNTTLDKGDRVQTASDGFARITFGDGTTYVVKNDTIVTVEENTVQREKTRVNMRVNTGTVDLTTPTWRSPDSRASVSVADAVASLRQNSRANVRTDPVKNESEITVNMGVADVKRGDEQLQVGPYEKAMFATGGPIARASVLAPPTLVEPVNLQTITVPDPKKARVMLKWTAVLGATSYQVRVSATNMFTRLAADKKVTSIMTDVTGLDAGEYFWSVSAIDDKKNASEASDVYKFLLVTQGKSDEMLLTVDSTLLHGSVVELDGRTEPGAALICNGQPIVNIKADGKFQHFTEPLTPGSHTITITGTNRRGGTATVRVPIVISK